jgi:hypothetical protein
MDAVRRFSTVAAISALGVLGVVSSAAPAGAAAPEIIHLPEESGSELFVQCDGFAIELAGSTKFDLIVFRDQSGEVVRVMRRGRVVETYTNTVTGKTVTNRGVFKDTFTRIDDTEQFRHTVVGFDFMATYPGEGLLLQSVGRKVFSVDGEELVFSAGQDNLPEGPEANAVFCAALA